MHNVSSFNLCHQGNGGIAVDSTPSQEDSYLSPSEYVKLIDCLGIITCDIDSSSSMH
jgi:hypothetical protein